MNNISIAMIVKNEEKNLNRLFQSFFELWRHSKNFQVVIMDTGSTDRTKQVAEDWKADVYDLHWCDDFSIARNFSLQQCTGDWILWLDADDELPELTSNWLFNATLIKSQVYLFESKSLLADGTSFVCSQNRLFPNHRGIEFVNPVYETLRPSIKKAGLNSVFTGEEIIHHGYKDPEINKVKRKRNDHILGKIINNHEPTILFALGREYQNIGKFEKALEYYQNTLCNCAEVNDIYIAASIYYGQTLMQMDKLDDACSFFGSHYVINPQYFFEYGRCMYIAGDARTETYLQKALDLLPWYWTIPTDWNYIKTEANRILKEIDNV